MENATKPRSVDSPVRLAIATAVSAEYAAIQAAFDKPGVKFEHERSSLRRPSWHGEIDGVPVDLALLGMGGENASRSMVRWISRQAHSQLILIGMSGALQPNLKRGHWIRGNQIYFQDTSTESLRLEESPDIPRSHLVGPLLSAPKLLSTAQSKVVAGLSTKALAVDLESWHITKTAETFSIPVQVWRVVLDEMDEELPDDLSVFQRPGEVWQKRLDECKASLTECIKYAVAAVDR